MKKLWYLLLAVCTVGAFAACSDDEDNTPAPSSPITECVVPATAEIGGTLAVTGKGFEASSSLYLRDEAGKDTALEDQKLTETGFEGTVPATLTPAAYTVMLKQNGDWTLGTVRLEEMAMPVTGYTVPETAVAGEKLEITGAGFDETSKIVLVAADGARTELNTVLTSAGVECELPADLAAGDYGVILVQKNRDWTLAEKITVAVRKRIVGFGMAMLEFEMEMYNYTFKYDESGTVASISLDSSMVGLPETEIFTVTTTGSRIEAATTEEGLMLAEQLDGAINYPDSFSWEMTDSRIEKGSTLVVNKTQNYRYEYDEAGRCTGIINEGTLRDDSIFEYDNGNCTGLDVESATVFAYEDAALCNNKFGMDVAQAFLLSGDSAERIFAVAFGYIGAKSVNLPTKVYGSEITYEFDGDGYVTKASFPMFDTMGCTQVLTFRYE